MHRVILGLLAVLFGLNVARQVGLDSLPGPRWAWPSSSWRGSATSGAGHRPASFCATSASPPSPSPCCSSSAPTPARSCSLEDAEVIEVEPGSDGPVAVVVLDELPLASLLTADGEINDAALPELRPAGRRVDLVPQRHVGPSVDAGLGARRSSPGSTPSPASCRPRRTGRSTSSRSWAASHEVDRLRGRHRPLPGCRVFPRRASPRASARSSPTSPTRWSTRRWSTAT